MSTHIIQRRNKSTETLNDLLISGREICKTSGTEGECAQCLADVLTPSTSFLLSARCRARTASSTHHTVQARRRLLVSHNGGACAGSLVRRAALPRDNGENKSWEPLSPSLSQPSRTPGLLNQAPKPAL